MSQRFTDQVVLVSGASRGIGRAAAAAFAREGARVVVNYRADEAGALETVREIFAAGGQAWPCQADVAQPAEIDRMGAWLERAVGPLSVLVNNAAAFNREAFLDVSLEEFDRVFSANVRGLFYLSQVAARGMVERRRGSIIHISSLLARLTVESRTVYSATKGAVESLTRAMALDLAPFNVRVNCIAVGMVRTEALLAGMPKPEQQAAAQRYIPGGRFGEPGELAEAILWLASDSAAYVNGTILSVDAGLGTREAKPL